MRKDAFSRALRTITSSPTVENRPALGYVHFKKDGSYVATDSHQLLRVENAIGNGIEFNLDPSSMTMSNLAYPETERLIPRTGVASTTFKSTDYAKIVQALKEIQKQQVGLKNRVIEVIVEDDLISFINEDHSVTFGIKKEPASEEVSFAVNPQYLINAFMLFRDYADQPQPVEMIFNGRLRPIVLKADGITYLITPVRIF